MSSLPRSSFLDASLGMNTDYNKLNTTTPKYQHFHSTPRLSKIKQNKLFLTWTSCLMFYFPKPRSQVTQGRSFIPRITIYTCQIISFGIVKISAYIELWQLNIFRLSLTVHSIYIFKQFSNIKYLVRNFVSLIKVKVTFTYQINTGWYFPTTQVICHFTCQRW